MKIVVEVIFTFLTGHQRVFLSKKLLPNINNK